MSDVIMVALITGGVSLAGSLFSFVASRSAAKQQSDLMVYRIDQLEGKVTKHNNLVERMSLVEASAKSAHKRIDRIDNEKE